MRRVLAGVVALVATLGVVAAPSEAAGSTVREIETSYGSVTLECTGSGSPTVVLLAGFGDAHTVWSTIQRKLSRHNRVCSYDRLGEGTSSAPRHRMSLSSNSRLLREVLRNAGERGRYVLVGHSIGGDIAARYARMFPRLTVGAVTLDATPPAFLNFVLRKTHDLSGPLAAAFRAEAVSILSGDNQERLKIADGRWAPARSLGRMPFAVVEHGRNIFAGLGEPSATEFQARWEAGERHLSHLSRRSQLIIATRSSHYIFLDQPRLTLDVVSSVLAQG